jgi:8-oxo-dGTP pyrophosphatase MutT (NUDIX family)
VLLQPDDLPKGSQDEKQVLLTIQTRTPAASLAFSELPAGMVDDSGTFAGAAAKEIKEELGNPPILSHSYSILSFLNHVHSTHLNNL